jgi:adenine-specific DNA-methyltransferase
MRSLLAAVRAPILLVSFNNEGYLSRAEMEEMLASRGHVEVVDIPYRRYVGAQIGIFNPSGQKVGRVSHLTNREHLYLVGPDPEVIRRAAHGVREAMLPLTRSLR